MKFVPHHNLLEGGDLVPSPPQTCGGLTNYFGQRNLLAIAHVAEKKTPRRFFRANPSYRIHKKPPKKILLPFIYCSP